MNGLQRWLLAGESLKIWEICRLRLFLWKLINDYLDRLWWLVSFICGRGVRGQLWVTYAVGREIWLFSKLGSELMACRFFWVGGSWFCGLGWLEKIQLDLGLFKMLCCVFWEVVWLVGCYHILRTVAVAIHFCEGVAPIECGYYILWIGHEWHKSQDH